MFKKFLKFLSRIFFDDKLDKEKHSTKISYEIFNKLFPDGNDLKVIFGIKKIDSKKIVYISALEIFENDELLEQFSLKDIRDIIYTATWEIFLLEKKY